MNKRPRSRADACSGIALASLIGRPAALPIRTRLTLAFAIAMAVVLTAMGVSVYLGVASALDETINSGLRARADDVAALVAQSDSGLRESPSSQLTESGQSLAQVLTLSGNVVDATPNLTDVPLLAPVELTRAAAGPITLERSSVNGTEGRIRLLATAVTAQDQTLIVVVGASLEARTEALSGLLRGLAIGGPLALIAAALLAYALASAALRPVESMRKEAEAISVLEPGRRLPLSSARDEVGKLGVTLNAMLARMESGLATERAFVSDASHELRTPLALLKAELDLALTGERSAEELRVAVRSAAEETDRLVQLSEDLLVLARAGQGRLPVRRETVQAVEILEGVKERFDRRAHDAGLSLEVSVPAGLTLEGDRLRLEQAIANLVENALRYGGSPVLLSARDYGERVELHVLDRGPGFNRAFLPRAFERFSRAEEFRSTGGSGLGLPIVEIIARAHGGTAHIANRDGGGADVWVSLPR